MRHTCSTASEKKTSASGLGSVALYSFSRAFSTLDSRAASGIWATHITRKCTRARWAYALWGIGFVRRLPHPYNLHDSHILRRSHRVQFPPHFFVLALLCCGAGCVEVAEKQWLCAGELVWLE